VNHSAYKRYVIGRGAIAVTSPGLSECTVSLVQQERDCKGSLPLDSPGVSLR